MSSLCITMAGSVCGLLWVGCSAMRLVLVLLGLFSVVTCVYIAVYLGFMLVLVYGGCWLWLLVVDCFGVVCVFDFVLCCCFLS